MLAESMTAADSARVWARGRTEGEEGGGGLHDSSRVQCVNELLLAGVDQAKPCARIQSVDLFVSSLAQLFVCVSCLLACLLVCLFAVFVHSAARRVCSKEPCTRAAVPAPEPALRACGVAVRTAVGAWSASQAVHNVCKSRGTQSTLTTIGMGAR